MTTELDVHAEAVKFLTECVKAAKAYELLNDPQRAVELFADAIVDIAAWREEMQKEIHARTAKPPTPLGRRGGVS